MKFKIYLWVTLATTIASLLSTLVMIPFELLFSGLQGREPLAAANLFVSFVGIIAYLYFFGKTARKFRLVIATRDGEQPLGMLFVFCHTVAWFLSIMCAVGGTAFLCVSLNTPEVATGALIMLSLIPAFWLSWKLLVLFAIGVKSDESVIRLNKD